MLLRTHVPAPQVQSITMSAASLPMTGGRPRGPGAKQRELPTAPRSG